MRVVFWICRYRLLGYYRQLTEGHLSVKIFLFCSLTFSTIKGASFAGNAVRAQFEEAFSTSLTASDFALWIGFVAPFVSFLFVCVLVSLIQIASSRGDAFFHSRPVSVVMEVAVSTCSATFLSFPWFAIFYLPFSLSALSGSRWDGSIYSLFVIASMFAIFASFLLTYGLVKIVHRLAYRFRGSAVDFSRHQEVRRPRRKPRKLDFPSSPLTALIARDMTNIIRSKAQTIPSLIASLISLFLVIVLFSSPHHEMGFDLKVRLHHASLAVLTWFICAPSLQSLVRDGHAWPSVAILPLSNWNITLSKVTSFFLASSILWLISSITSAFILDIGIRVLMISSVGSLAFAFGTIAGGVLIGSYYPSFLRGSDFFNVGFFAGNVYFVLGLCHVAIRMLILSVFKESPSLDCVAVTGLFSLLSLIYIGLAASFISRYRSDFFGRQL